MKLYYDQPARNWHESLPLGNGRLGATVYGGTKKETLALNEDTLWSGYPEKTQKELPEGYLTQGPGADRETGVSESAGLSAGLLQDF